MTFTTRYFFSICTVVSLDNVPGLETGYGSTHVAWNLFVMTGSQELTALVHELVVTQAQQASDLQKVDTAIYLFAKSVVPGISADLHAD